MSSLRNIKQHVQAVRQNKGILLTDQMQLVALTTAPTDANLADGRIYYNSTATKAYLRAGSAWIDLTGGAVGGVTTWDAMYALDQNLNITATYGTMTYTVTGNTAGLTLNKTGAGAGGVLVIANAGTGDDITGPAWSIISTGSVGIVELASGGTINATDGALTIGSTATETTFAGTLSIDGGATADALTVDAGDVVVTDGSLTLTDGDEASSVVITNDTAAAVNVVEIQADAIAAGGVLLHLDSLAAGMSTGKFFECHDGTNPAFSIALYGAVTIAGNASDVFTITLGDAVLSDGSLTITDADDATTLSVTNNSAAAASLIEFAGSGTFTGTTTTSFMTITPSGMAAGTAVYLPLAAMDSGTGIQIVANAITSGQALEITSSATTLATSGRLFLIDHSGATGTTAVIAEVTSDATDETTVLRLTATNTLLAGFVLDISAVALTTGTCIDVQGLAAITTGKVIHIDADGVTQTDGILVHIDSASTAITSTGRLLLVDHTGNATDTIGVIAEFASAATDETLIVKISASAALALGAMLHFEGASVTTGDIIIAEALDALTTGIGVHIESGATAITGAGRLAYFNHTGATTTAGTLVEIASAADDETIMFQLTATSTLIDGEIIKVTAASMTTGTVLEAISLDALTTGIGVHIESGATAITGAGRLLRIDHTGATTTTAGIIAEIASAATDETIITKITASGALAAGFMLQLAGSSVTTGDIIAAEALDALTDGIGIHIESGSTAITATGGLAYFNHTGNATVSGVLIKALTAATDETVLLGLTASSTITGTMVSITADSSFTGKGIDVSMDALTTGVMINLHSDSADIVARDLLHIHNDNTAAVGTVPLTIVQDALQGTGTKFQKLMTLGGTTIWRSSDQTTPNAALTGADGDICLNGPNSTMFYATNGVGQVWATVT